MNKNNIKCKNTENTWAKENKKILKYSLQQDGKDFISFIRSNSLLTITTSFFILLTYGIKLFQYSISIDTECILNNQQGLLNSWMSIGRYGLVAIKYILGTTTFTPYVATFLMLCSLFLLCMLLSFCFNYFYTQNSVMTEEETGKVKLSLIIFSSVFISAPILVEQFNFLLQGFEVAIAMTMSVIAAFLLTKWAMCKSYKDNLLYVILGIVLLIFSISAYQSIMFFFVSVTSVFFIIKYICDYKNKQSNINYEMMIVRQIFAFIVSSFIYLVINKIIQMICNIKTSYLDDKFLWNKVPINRCLKNVFLYFKYVMLGDNLFFTKWFLVFTIILICIYLGVLCSNYQKKLMFTIGIIILFISPFILSFYLGNFIDIRAQLSLPFVFAVEAMLLIMCCNAKYLKICVSLVLVFIALKQSYMTNKLFYGEQMKYENDVEIGRNIADRIGLLGLGEIPDKPVVILGIHSCKGVILKGEVLGHSFWEWDGDTIGRKLGLMKVIGYPYLWPTQEQIDMAREMSINLPSYPSDGCVIDGGEFIIVKLSD